MLPILALKINEGKTDLELIKTSKSDEGKTGLLFFFPQKKEKNIALVLCFSFTY